MTNQRLKVPHQLNDDAAEMVASVWESESEQSDLNDHSDQRVTPDTCTIMREMVDRGLSPREVSQEVSYVSHKQVNYHVSGRCSCDDNDAVRYDECMRMRIAHRKGAPPRTLALLNDISKSTVWDHLCGDCSHEDGITPTVAVEQPESPPGVGAD